MSVEEVSRRLKARAPSGEETGLREALARGPYGGAALATEPTPKSAHATAMIAAENGFDNGTRGRSIVIVFSPLKARVRSTI